jgi:ABC-type multidrug transport system fused ATPase/permease subunit
MILLLSKGELVAKGSHDDLLKTSELYAEILETQFGDRAELMAVVEEEMAL